MSLNFKFNKIRLGEFQLTGGCMERLADMWERDLTRFQPIGHETQYQALREYKLIEGFDLTPRGREILQEFCRVKGMTPIRGKIGGLDSFQSIDSHRISDWLRARHVPTHRIWGYISAMRTTRELAIPDQRIILIQANILTPMEKPE